VILIVVIAIIAGIVKGMGSTPEETEPETTTEAETTVEETELQTSVIVDGIDITGMSREEARAAIEDEYAWSMKITYNDDSYEVSNLLSTKIDSLLDEIYSGEPEESYALDTSGLEDAITAEASAAAAKWDKKAKNGSISSYDTSTDKFVFSGSQQGIAVDQDRLKDDIAEAIKNKKFDAEIKAQVGVVEAEYSESTAKDKYKTISSFTTNTTANSNRNTNVKLAAQAINGTVLQPGEEFSFNSVVGQRTEEKGFKSAAAYNNGEVVAEIGGGVCQVSSTLYNAVVKAGLKTTFRRSHTFEPTYVTPGTDAAVSWGYPDYKFVNNSSTAIGIRASYSNQTVTVSIYGIPILEDGVTYSLKSTKTKDYTTGTEAEQASGLQSAWETRLVITKNGEVVSQNVDHTSTYKSHTKANDAADAEAIRAAESQAAADAESSKAAEESASQTIAETLSEAAPESTTSSDSGSGITSAPGSSSGSSTTTSGPGSTGAPGSAQITETTAAAVPTSAAVETTAASAPTAAPTVASPAPAPTEAQTQAVSPGNGNIPMVEAKPGA
jgi:vancomycin resistance protein YoaR